MSDLERDRAAHMSDARRCIQSGMQVTYTTVRGLLRALDQEHAERDALLAKFEALADEFHRTADACRNYADARAGLSDEANLRTAEAVNRNRAIELRAVIAEARA